MAYPDRTYGTVTLPGAASTTKFLDTPVNGGRGGSDTPGKTKAIEALAATEATGVGQVESTA